MKYKQIQTIIRKLHLKYSEADLGNLKDPVEELVYICLTRQTHSRNANRSWKAIKDAGSLYNLLDMPIGQIELLLQPSGLSRQKAMWIQQSLRQIHDRIGSLSMRESQNWTDREAEEFLCSLPGVSIKSAKCIMLYSMGRNVLPVDTHVRRISTRIGLVPSRLTERAIHDCLEEIIPRKSHFSFHVNCIWHGRKTCVALKPKCNSCIIKKQCEGIEIIN